MQNEKCFICGQDVTHLIKDESSSNYHFDCPFCGKYIVSEFLFGKSEALKQSTKQSIFDNEDLYKISSVIRENTELINNPIKIYSDPEYNKTGEMREIHYSEIPEYYPNNHENMIDRILILLEKKAKKLFDVIGLNLITDQPLLFAKDRIHMKDIVRSLKEIGLINQIEDRVSPDKIFLQITARGVERIENLKHKSNSNIIFVAMPFDKEYEYIFSDLIKPAVESIGLIGKMLEPLRVDAPQLQDKHEGTIDDLIIDGIKNAKLIIADLTNRNPGVYFEAGYALGIGKKVLFTTEDIKKDKAHFDINHRPILEHSKDKINKEEFIKRLSLRIKAQLET